MSERAEIAGFPAQPDADRQQAEYFLRLLDAQKSETSQLLESRLVELAAFERAGYLTCVRRHRHIVKDLGSEIRAVDRMLVALRVRLAMPTLRCPDQPRPPVADASHLLEQALAARVRTDCRQIAAM